MWYEYSEERHLLNKGRRRIIQEPGEKGVKIAELKVPYFVISSFRFSLFFSTHYYIEGPLWILGEEIRFPTATTI